MLAAPLSVITASRFGEGLAGAKRQGGFVLSRISCLGERDPKNRRGPCGGSKIALGVSNADALALVRNAGDGRKGTPTQCTAEPDVDPLLKGVSGLRQTIM